MRKLIEKQQEFLITCDNSNCDYKLEYTDENEEYLFLYIDRACPKCGQNLLTREDYMQYQKLIKIVNFINRYFSWITIFYSKNSWNKRKTVSIKVHNGIDIKN
jgi:hypothetical protein